MTNEITNTDIQLAVIGGAHGIKGEVRVKSFTDNPLAFGDYGKLHDKNGNKYQVIKARVSKNVVVTRFKSVDTREKAEAINGIELFIDRARLPQVEDEDEFYLSDLDGLDCVDEAGTVIGFVKGVHNFGAGDIIEVQLAKGGDAFYPFTKKVVPIVNIEAGTLTLIPPAEVSERDLDDLVDVQDISPDAEPVEADGVVSEIDEASTLRQAQAEAVGAQGEGGGKSNAQNKPKVNTGPNTPREGKRKKGGN